MNHTNRLSKESSPYLLQHAHNPVDWYPWGEEALERARREDLPILVSIGYAACHWCHVMERESFEDPEVAELMNKNFINIKIDREERPDLDHIYMDAVQAITGQGGWPLNVFLTPDLRPFYGGTYFPPQRAFNRSSWTEVLLAISDAYRNKRQDIESQAENLTEHLNNSNSFGITNGSGSGNGLHKAFAEEAFTSIMKSADRQLGGFGKAPKFPQSFTIRFLLHYYYYTGDNAAAKQALLSLDKMAMGGIYDQLGGGFARYSTDAEWLAPHFEKMLYDNALLLVAYTEAYQLSGNPFYQEIVMDTIGFVERELLSPEYGFYSALDADSEGVEGKYYVWTPGEIQEVLGGDASLFNELYDVTAVGNWEHQNILRLTSSYGQFAEKKGMDIAELMKKISGWKLELLKKREERVRPLLDDKILLGWNSLMNSALTRAFAVFREDRFLALAEKNMQFLLERFSREDILQYHTYKAGEARYPAFLDDLAFTIQALIDLHDVTGNTGYLEKARQIVEKVQAEFKEQDTGFFFFTGKEQVDVIVRKKEIYDGAIPSGNATMASVLYLLGMLYDEKEWVAQSTRMMGSMAAIVKKYPTSFGVWATFIQAVVAGIPEIAVIGPAHRELTLEISGNFLPVRILQQAEVENDDFPLLRGKPAGVDTRIYLCRNYSCSQPVTTTRVLLEQLGGYPKL